jgi:hypothetical protein
MKTEAQLEVAQALAAERQNLRDLALAERDAMRAELDGVRRESTLAAEQRQHDFQEQARPTSTGWKHSRKSWVGLV